MSHNGRPPVPPSSASPDELDRMFAGYLRAQMPTPWPACPTPSALAPTVRREGQAGSSTRSRLTLAVSVAGLLGLGLAVSSIPLAQPIGSDRTVDAPARLLDGATADGTKMLNELHRRRAAAPR